MKSKFKLLIFSMIFLVMLSLCGGSASAQIRGRILDEQGAALPGATVMLLPDSLARFTDAQGRFHFDIGHQGEHSLLISFVGYQTYRHLCAKDMAEPLVIRLEPSNQQIAEVLVREGHGHFQSALQTDYVSQDFLRQNTEGNLAKSLEKMAGLSAMTVGVGIGKPVIRGLSANRVVVVADGVKQEGQQWGNDHGLELDQFAIERVELIKGPGSLRFGSDGLGGVLNVLPNFVPRKNSVSASLSGIYKTNNQHVGSSARLALNREDFFLDLRYSLQSYADYRVAAERFTYLDYVLPLEDGVLKNTAGHEESLSITLGIRRNLGVSRVSFTQYFTEAGLFSGAVGFPTSYSLAHDGDYRDKSFPKQKVRHQKWAYNQNLHTALGQFHLDLGLQVNDRREFSFPEFHSQAPGYDRDDQLALWLKLLTTSAEARLESDFSPHWANTFGASAQRQHNQVGGFEFLIPDFDAWRMGIYDLGHLHLGEKNMFHYGLRLDWARNTNPAHSQNVYDSNGEVSSTLEVAAVDHKFMNWSGGLGLIRTIKPEKIDLYLNFGKSFRVPYPSETSSNGIHHGTFRHEVGKSDLESESGYQFDASVQFHNERFFLTGAVFFNYFQDFIYLAPQARFSTLPEAGQLYAYQQNDAIYTGAELDWEFRANEFWTLEVVGEYVHNVNLETLLPLPFTPPGSLLFELKRGFASGERWTNSFTKLSSHTFLAQNRVDRNEAPTPAFHLLGFAVGTELRVKNLRMEFSLLGQNLLNAPYVNHLSRYKLLNLPEQGRNFVLSLRIPLEADWGS